MCYELYPIPTGQTEEDVDTTNPPTVEVDSPDILSDERGNNRDLRRPTRDVGRNKRQYLGNPDDIVDPFAPRRNASERCCYTNCTVVYLPKENCSYYKASSYFTVF